MYGYIGSMKAKAGHGDDIVSILLSGVDRLREAGCHLYVVSSAQADDDTIWVSEPLTATVLLVSTRLALAPLDAMTALARSIARGDRGRRLSPTRTGRG